MNDERTLALAPEANSERIYAGTGVERPTSDNGNYGTYALGSPFDLPPSDELLAASDILIVARFWSHVDKNGPVHSRLGTRCWLWTANIVGHGNKTHPVRSRHGQFTYRLRPGRPGKAGTPQRHIYAHRFAWVIAHGHIPFGLNVLHHCDVPPCVNDAHHYLGTQDDNMKDASARQRFTVPKTRKLSLYDRLDIFHAPPCLGICVDLARQYGVTKAAISLIRRGRFLGSGRWLGTKAPKNKCPAGVTPAGHKHRPIA